MYPAGAGKKTEPEFGRFPAHAEKLLPELVWNMRRNTSGMYVEFITDSPNVTIRWEMADEQIGEPNFNACAFSGIDLYILVGKKWRYAVARIVKQLQKEFPQLYFIDLKNAMGNDSAYGVSIIRTESIVSFQNIFKSPKLKGSTV